MGTLGANALQAKARETRIPFVRRCRLELEDGRVGTAFLVNLNATGAYVALDDLRKGGPGHGHAEPPADMPRLHESLRCVFRLPGRDRDVVVEAVVSWVNPRQQHPVHSLPPGFGLSFQDMSKADRAAIVWLVDEYLAKHPQAR
jgi:PilZ domain-containing protein